MLHCHVLLVGSFSFVAQLKKNLSGVQITAAQAQLKKNTKLRVFLLMFMMRSGERKDMDEDDARRRVRCSVRKTARVYPTSKTWQ